MSEIVKCPTCGRAPSERNDIKGFTADQVTGVVTLDRHRCTDAVHDLADRAVEMAARVETARSALIVARKFVDHIQRYRTNDELADAALERAASKAIEDALIDVGVPPLIVDLRQP